MKKSLDGDKAVVMISPVDDLVMLIHKENILAKPVENEDFTLYMYSNDNNEEPYSQCN
jgi:hypothetical protein